MNRSFENFVSVSLVIVCIGLGITSAQLGEIHRKSHLLELQIDSLRNSIDSTRYILPNENLITPEVDSTAMNIDDLMSAIIYVESRGDAQAFNETSRATGCMQLMPIMVKEVNRICKLRGIQKTFTMDDRWSCKKSKQMFRIWYGFHHRDSPAERIARHWWGGPKWGEHDISMAYWEKVKDRLDV